MTQISEKRLRILKKGLKRLILWQLGCKALRGKFYLALVFITKVSMEEMECH